MARSDEVTDDDAVPAPRPRRFPEIARRQATLDALDLEPLMTECPQCGTRFRVTEAQLQAARGRVRCGSCSAVFDGVDQLVLDMPVEFGSTQDAVQALDALLAELLVDSPRVPPPPQAGLDAEPQPDRGPGPGVESGLGQPAEGQGEAGSAASVAPVLESGVTADAAPVVAAMLAPVEVSDRSSPPGSGAVTFGAPQRARRLWPWLMLPVGVLAIAAQVLWFRFDTLVRDPAWRPIYAGVCELLGCRLPVQRALDRIATRNLTVRASREQPGVLEVRAVIVNEAGFAQPFPALEVRFSDLNGILVAGHRLQPNEYLAGDARGLELMPPGTPVQLHLTVPDPGENAVSYALNLR